MTPRSTYRIQLRPEFGFDDAAAVAAYLRDLGVSHVYASPYLQAAPGSTHGYDVVDHSKVNDELGGAEAHARFCGALGEAGLGQVLDIVPNHMAVTPENAWWTDVLENGPSSIWAAHFDVDWDPPERKLRNTVLLPVLGDHYGRVLEAGELELVRDGGSFWIRYFERSFPVAPRTYDVILGLAAATGADELAFLANAAAALPPATATDRPSALARHRDKEVLKRHIAALADHTQIDAAVATINADCDLLDELLQRQNYRLAWWRTAGEELDYRRFFDITTLAGLRVEDEQVFLDTHRLVVDWLAEGVLDGVRIDHPDGLRDPGGYVERLRAAAPDAWIVVEKILEPGERLPEAWPVDGTTGYDFLNVVGGLFVDLGEDGGYDALVDEAKRLVVAEVLAADVNRLAKLLGQVCEQERRYRDFTRRDLWAVLSAALVAFPVYRTYVRPGEPVTDVDRRTIDEVLATLDAHDPELVELLGRVLRGELDGPGAELCLRFQQTSGPVMAKGVEDTTFYRYSRNTALNEVGGHPGSGGTTVAAFHAAMADRHGREMLASSTHDTKRSEDVRARIALLSEGVELPAWPSGPDPELEPLLVQAFVGAHPISFDRAVAYAEKASKEAKRHTSWIDPDPAYDEALRAWVEQVLPLVGPVAEPLVEPGWVNALAMQALKLTAPGVPDVYQGTELWDLSLVDPDNRRPVDFAARRTLLEEVRGMAAAEAWARRAEGVPKLWLTHRALHLRPEGAYEPLAVEGPAADHVVAFSRGGKVATVVPRLVLTLERNGGWRGTTVAGRPVEELLGDFPVYVGDTW